ncbi:helix-turn-helix transcriptional regulator [Bacillus sp. FSL W7-1360]
MSVSIGQRISQLRKQQKMTQKALADCYFSSTYVSQVENNQKEPSEKFLIHICKRLNVSLDDLLDKDLQVCEEEIETIAAQFWEHLSLTETERAFLQLHACESHRPVVLVRVYGVLLRDYVIRGLIGDAERLHVQAQTLLPADLKELGDQFACMVYYHACGQLFFSKQDFVQADVYMTKAAQYLQCHDESTATLRLLFDLSAVKQRIHNDMSIPLQYSYRLYDILSRSDDKVRFVHAALKVGAQHRLSRYFEYAEKFYREAYDCAARLNDAYTLSFVYYHLGLLHKAKEEWKEAKAYMLKSLLLQQETEVAEKERAYVLKELLVIAMEEKDWEQVDDYLLKVSAIIDQNQEVLNYMDIEVQAIKAKRLLYQGDAVTYERDMERILDHAISKKQYKLVCRFAEQLGRYYQEKRAYKKAARYLVCACDYRY